MSMAKSYLMLKGLFKKGLLKVLLKLEEPFSLGNPWYVTTVSSSCSFGHFKIHKGWARLANYFCPSVKIQLFWPWHFAFANMGQLSIFVET